MFALLGDEFFACVGGACRPFDDQGANVAEANEGEDMSEIGELEILRAALCKWALPGEYELEWTIG